ncbi:MAG: CsgG/HfaB family protein [bacterium]
MKNRIVLFILVFLCVKFPSSVLAIEQDTLVIMYFTNRGENKDWKWLSKGLADMLITDLFATSRFKIVEREKLQEFLKEVEVTRQGVFDQSTALQVGKVAKAQKVLFGSFEVQEKDIVIEAHIIDISTGELQRVEWVRGKSDSIIKLVKQLVFKIVKRLNITLTEDEKHSIRYVYTDSIDSLKHFYNAIDAYERSQFPQAIAEARLSLKKDPDFVKASYWLGKIYEFTENWEHAALVYEKALDRYPQERLKAPHRYLVSGTNFSDWIPYGNEKYPDNRFVRYIENQLTFIYEDKMNDYAKSLKVYTKIIERYPMTKMPPDEMKRSYWKKYREIVSPKHEFDTLLKLEERRRTQLAGKKLDAPTPYERELFQPSGLNKIKNENTEAYGYVSLALLNLARAYEKLGNKKKAYESYNQAYHFSRWNFSPHTCFDDIFRLYTELCKEGECPSSLPANTIEFNSRNPIYTHDYRNSTRFKDALIASLDIIISLQDPFLFKAPPGYCIEKLDCHYKFKIIKYHPWLPCLAIYSVIGAERYFPSKNNTLVKNLTQEGEMSEVNYTCTLPKEISFFILCATTGARGTNTPISWSIRAHLSKKKAVKAVGRLEIKINQPKAKIYLNGKLVATSSPFIWNNIPYGRYKLKVTKEDFEDYKEDIEISSNRILIKNITLKMPSPSGWRRIQITDKSILDTHAKNICFIQGMDGTYYCVYSGADKNLYIVTSPDLIQWTKPRKLSVSSSDNDKEPRLIQNRQGVFILTWRSNRPTWDKEKGKKNLIDSLFMASSEDLTHWSYPVDLRKKFLGPYPCIVNYAFYQDRSAKYWLILRMTRTTPEEEEKNIRGEVEVFTSNDNENWKAEKIIYNDTKTREESAIDVYFYQDQENVYWLVSKTFYNVPITRGNVVVDNEQPNLIKIYRFMDIYDLKKPVHIIEKTENISNPSLIKSCDGGYVLCTLYSNYIAFSKSEDGKKWTEPKKTIKCWLPDRVLFCQDKQGRYIVVYTKGEGIFLLYTDDIDAHQSPPETRQPFNQNVSHINKKKGITDRQGVDFREIFMRKVSDLLIIFNLVIIGGILIIIVRKIKK